MLDKDKPMTTPTDQLTALHELAKSCPGGVGACEWWAGWVCITMGQAWYTNENGSSEVIDDQHALDLVTAEAERWLAGKGWAIAKCRGDTHYMCSNTFGSGTLPEALSHAMNEHKSPPPA